MVTAVGTAGWGPRAGDRGLGTAASPAADGAPDTSLIPGTTGLAPPQGGRGPAAHRCSSLQRVNSLLSGQRVAGEVVVPLTG